MDNRDAILASLKRAAAALRDAGIPYAVGGGLAFYAYGGNASNHDVDLMVREDDAVKAQQVLVDAGMKAEDPPEEWLLKVYDGDVLIDLIFHPEGLPITDEVLARAQERVVEAMHMTVLDLNDATVTRLLAFDERSMDVVGMIPIARALREQIDWHASASTRRARSRRRWRAWRSTPTRCSSPATSRGSGSWKRRRCSPTSCVRAPSRWSPCSATTTGMPAVRTASRRCSRTPA